MDGMLFHIYYFIHMIRFVGRVQKNGETRIGLPIGNQTNARQINIYEPGLIPHP